MDGRFSFIFHILSFIHLLMQLNDAKANLHRKIDSARWFNGKENLVPLSQPTCRYIEVTLVLEPPQL